MTKRAEDVLKRYKPSTALGTSASDEKKTDDFNASDPEAVEKQKKKAQRRKDENEEVVKNILSTPHGRAWISDILIFCDVMGNPLVQGSPDGTGFNIGMENVGKMLLNQIFESDPDKYSQMLREARKRNE